MLHKKTTQENVAFGLAVLKYYLRFNSKANLQDANVSSEELISNLVNILNEKNFICTSEISANYPGIDAIDKINRLGLQITHTKTNLKINKTIDKIRDNKVNNDIGVLYFFITSRKQKKYTITAQCPNLNVTENNILDFDSLVELLSQNQNKLAQAEAELIKAMPRLYQDGKARYEVMFNSILVARKELDRRVFTAGKFLEEPEEMLLSLREIRIVIQKTGIMNEANSVVSSSFKEIINIINDAESQIAKKYTSGYKKYKAGIFPSWDYPDKGECLNILMGIRKDVLDQINNIDIEINKLKGLLGIQ
ncbi:SMEK domain-containing protein [Morganella morganii]|uniref:SMEK domain-containing protein n=1 Tax=Morganella morganii TaxID=582 RepID=UPI00298E76DB|nr:SMEK domain-containing protein [Morganella morganii]MDW7783321.1 SMEK domain-containing protein [Morganella morganii]MDW7789258.1 SMEK domain-containing protein [Morganella morganii]